jgi:hypothetical protein
VKWTIRIEVTLDDDNGPTTRDVGTITRPIADLSPEQIGLTLEEGQQLLRGIQMAIIGVIANRRMKFYARTITETHRARLKRNIGRHQPGCLMATAESRCHHHHHHCYYCVSRRERGFALRD